MKVSVNGVLLRVAKSRGSVSRADRFMLKEIARLYNEGRKAWLAGDRETAASMFSVLV